MATKFITKLETEADVRKWFRELINIHEVIFHPDENVTFDRTTRLFFTSYGNTITVKQTYNDIELSIKELGLIIKRP
jgi:hypothetical protein